MAVDVEDGCGKGLSFEREINIADNELFYVGMADFTAGYRTGSNHIEDVKPGEFDSVFTRAPRRLLISRQDQGALLLTASADTREGPLEDIFQGFDGRTPRQLPAAQSTPSPTILSMATIRRRRGRSDPRQVLCPPRTR